MWAAETVLVCALSLLHRSAASFPPIEFVETRSPYASANADAYVPQGGARIYLITTSPAFTRARRAIYKCGELNAIRKIASVLVHEEWHVRHGSDEVGAYTARCLRSCLSMPVRAIRSITKSRGRCRPQFAAPAERRGCHGDED